MTRAPTFYDLNRKDLSGLSVEISQARAMLAHTFEGASFVGLMRLSENELKDYLWAAHSRVVEADGCVKRVLERNRFNTAVEAATFEEKPAGQEYTFTDLRLESMRNLRGFNLLEQVLDLAGKAEVHDECTEYARDIFQVIQDFVRKAKSTLAHMEPSVRQSEVVGAFGDKIQDCDQAMERAVETLHWLSSEKPDSDVAEALVRRAYSLVDAAEALLNAIKREEPDCKGSVQCRELLL